ncbi:hypothetical protein [Rhizobium tumorigenes]|uniref:PAC domain-containing protein n=1 Tax=Rhizobium tumorigenes TaxID=2041385 RepID=A0AAF1KSU5_9HYPH|nr:hypothetical protein [Rhizobium tumorigenes]WFR98018.1 hypothetical protein PR017_19220 [Rhizobium tumorigenes]WFS03560.1 hypothetical protein PR016_19995 [Rhizobium tumorigenes]
MFASTSQDGPHRGLTSQRGSDGKLYVSDFSLTPIFDEDGTVAFLMPEANDITALKTTQEELVRREREIRSLGRALINGVCKSA